MSEPQELRPVTAIIEGHTRKLKRNPIPPPPKIAWLALDQLVVDGAYQRSLSGQSHRLIRRLVENWDWNCFKPLSVAATGGGLYKIIDGQHTAIAAATHGAIETLPCLVLDAATVAEQARAFVGINRDRVSLTPYALYRSRLAAGDEEAVAVDEGLRMAGAQVIEGGRWREREDKPGDLACISSALQVVRAGGKNRLARIMKLMVAADVGPVPAALLKGVDHVMRAPAPPSDEVLGRVLTLRGDNWISEEAKDRMAKGLAPSWGDAISQVLLRECERAA